MRSGCELLTHFLKKILVKEMEINHRDISTMWKICPQVTEFICNDLQICTMVLIFLYVLKMLTMLRKEKEKGITQNMRILLLT